jgi:hypothetical protein
MLAGLDRFVAWPAHRGTIRIDFRNDRAFVDSLAGRLAVRLAVLVHCPAGTSRSLSAWIISVCVRFVQEAKSSFDALFQSVF